MKRNLKNARKNLKSSKKNLYSSKKVSYDERFLSSILDRKILQTFMDSLPVMFYIAKPTPPFKTIYISKGFEVFGYPLEKWREEPDFWIQCLHPDDRQRVLTETEKYSTGDFQIDYEYRLIGKEGKTFWIHDRSIFLRDEKGNPVCWQGLMLDTTNRKKAEEALKESEERYRKVFENASDLIYIHDLEGRYLSVNKAATELFGYSESEIQSLNISEAIAPDHLEFSKQMLRDKIAGVKQTAYELDCLSKNGERITLEINSSLINRDGLPVAVQGIARDITERNRTMAALKTSEENYKDLFENANDLIYTHDLAGNFTSLNRAGEKITGFSRKEALEMNITQVVAPGFLDSARAMIDRKISGESTPAYELEIIAKDGRRVNLELSTRLIFQEGKAIGIQGIGRDITERKHTETSLQNTISLFTSTFDSTAEGILVINPAKMEIITCNKKFLEMWKAPDSIFVENDLQKLIDFTATQIKNPVNFLNHSANLLQNPLATSTEILEFKDGRIYERYAQPQYLNEKPVGRVCCFRDVTERSLAEHALKSGERQYRMLTEGIVHQVWTSQPNGRLDFVNQRTLEYFGKSREEILGEGWKNVIHPEDIDVCIGRWANSLQTGEDYETEFRLKRSDGTYRWHVARATAGRDADGNIIKWFGTSTDINDKKAAETKLQHFATHDDLTGLPNRAQFINYLRLAIEKGEKNLYPRFAVLFLDLDRFKVINDSLGHSVGDKLLIAVAEKLKSCIRPGDIVARLGGDEFTILLNRAGDLKNVTKIAERLQSKISRPVMFDNYEVFTTTSIGIVLSDDVNRQPEDYLRDADSAMYRAKEAGKSRYEIFDSKMHAQNLHLLKMETDLRYAVEREEFEIFYQPLINLKTGKIIELEALIRWNHPQMGLIRPRDFIEIAEETGSIIPIGRWIINESCRQIGSWQEQFPGAEALSVSVNLSAKQLMHPRLTTEIKEVLSKNKFNARQLNLEVTESTVMVHRETAMKVLKRLDAMGISLSTDDFGTGYSSLSYLHEFPFKRLKIDRSFISRMDRDENSEAIVRTILLLGQNLKLEVVAEGIETVIQLEKLQSLGCCIGQGYLFSKPLCTVETEKLLREGLSTAIAQNNLPFNAAFNPETIQLEELQ